MGRRILQQRRGKGSPTWRTSKYAYRIHLTYPSEEGEGVVSKFISISGHSAPLVMIKTNKRIFFNVATEGLEVGQKVGIGPNSEVKSGSILPLSKIPLGTSVCNVETVAMNGGKLVRSSGLSANVLRKTGEGVTLLLPSRKEMIFDEDARATVGIVAGGGRTEKPFVKAGRKHHLLKARNKHYHRTSPIKRNAVNHPWGGGRGKNMGKSGIAPRWASPGRKVGLLKPRKTGRGGKRG